ncbi:cytochrome c oxidase assembly protein CtaG [Aureimonas sp. SA4125]|uniref:cytochrome c oxidase assembly protein n=1 Tax=Aureimonas sp. SA4125 TaxID=2826993 RepID=UPI001CC78E65|nr:cytochrome c oxidase assembly protein [Aureimonas sp. SA4125]BDA83096.1 cytochrome c oxidase assembly protein CtaG [Aureimonas sp. SA4125]
MPDTRPLRSAQVRRRDTTIAVACLAFACGMVGAAYAAVPLYQMFCQVTGYGGTTQRADAAPTRIIDRKVAVRFDANASPSVPWSFKPMEREVVVRLGEVQQTSYFVKNLSNERITAQATYNVTPITAGSYFNKISCFCFTDQTLEPGESREMPIVFFVDPAMLETEELKDAPAITLSYTFFREDKPAPVAEAPSSVKANDKL